MLYNSFKDSAIHLSILMITDLIIIILIRNK